MGFEPLQILDYKGLVGDTSDNLPGIKGVGEKTAIKLINQYGSLEGIYEHIDELKGKTQELFINGKETAFTCKYLATLRKDANINYLKEDLKLISPNREKLVEFFTKYEFASLLKKIQKEVFGQQSGPSLNIISPAFSPAGCRTCPDFRRRWDSRRRSRSCRAGSR